MGIGIGISRSSYDRYTKCRGCNPSQEKPPKFPNPDPLEWSVLNSFEENGYLLVELRYPDCTNYEGKKIMLYQGVKLNELKQQKRIDPHFSDNPNFHSPIARFEPTWKGWQTGLLLMKNLYMVKSIGYELFSEEK